ncbi:MAG: hypothetical protein IPG50_03905 [Myxococcales bacterium]|nr:hypothetical protein [Myxococcales bacterium]
MSPPTLLSRHAPLVGALALAAGLALGACGRTVDFHETGEVKSQLCVSCHQGAYDATRNPKHAGLFPTTCNDCHGTVQWVPAKALKHEWFPLRNRHASATCTDCHTKGFQPGATPNKCVGCHQKDFDAAKAPPHAGYSTDCASCHTDQGWRPASFEHPWALEGAHTKVSCFNCHTGTPPTFKGTPKDCVGCHADDHKNAPFPNHATFATTCTDCHNTTAWKPFVHAYPLDGAHKTANCTGCHTGNPPKYKGTAKDCVACHADDQKNAPFPGHATFPATCTNCHNTAAWKPFVHASPLTGAHTTAACNGCHTGTPAVYKGTATACASCHLADYQGSPYPGHSAFPQTCLDCHTTGAWKPAVGGAHPDSKFRISSGSHNKPCLSCHNASLGSSVGGANTDCVSCHSRAKYDAIGEHRNNPQYPKGAAPANFCLDCHPTGRN